MSDRGALAKVAAEAEHCRRCDLWRNATQTVFGEGRARATVLLVGEQPGDQEDLQGHPFVGPAGRILDQALAAAELDRERLYVTNAVKHFKFEPRGKRRLHKKPNNAEIDICRWWLAKELEIVQPKVAVALGVSALRGLTGKSLGIAKSRGTALKTPEGVPVMATVHPSSILRQRDEDRALAFKVFVKDLIAVRKFVEGA